MEGLLISQLVYNVTNTRQAIDILLLISVPIPLVPSIVEQGLREPISPIESYGVTKGGKTKSERLSGFQLDVVVRSHGLEPPGILLECGNTHYSAISVGQFSRNFMICLWLCTEIEKGKGHMEVDLKIYGYPS